MSFSFVLRSLIRSFDLRRRYFRSEEEKKNEFFFCSSLAYSYLWLAPKVLSLGKTKKKEIFSLLFARLFVPLHQIFNDEQLWQRKY